jgi:glucosamine--fructose-6-phosphate aminotransferase (isomerizing)
MSTSQLNAMIAAQPESLRSIATLDLTDHTARLAGAQRVLLVGTGTSLHAAELGAALLQGASLDARALASSIFARWSPPLREGDAVILISHTGETAYARAAREIVRAAGVPLVCITGPQAGWEGAITTPLAETAETYSVSYTATLGVLSLIGDALGAPSSGPDALTTVASALEPIIASGDRWDGLLPERALAVIGAGPWSITAREGALKIREAARLLCEGFDAERFLHGAAVPYRPGDVLIAVQPDADPDGLVHGLLDTARDEGLRVETITQADPPTSPLLAQIVPTVRLQLLAAELADKRGTDPDVAIVGGWGSPDLWRAGAPG